MKPLHTVLFIAPISLMAAGFGIGGRDGAVFSIIGAVALLAVSVWQVVKMAQQFDKVDKQK